MGGPLILVKKKKMDEEKQLQMTAFPNLASLWYLPSLSVSPKQQHHL